MALARLRFKADLGTPYDYIVPLYDSGTGLLKSGVTALPSLTVIRVTGTGTTNRTSRLSEIGGSGLYKFAGEAQDAADQLVLFTITAMGINTVEVEVDLESSTVLNVANLPAHWIAAGHQNLIPNDPNADNSTRLKNLMADIVDLNTGSPNAVKHGVHLHFPPGQFFYFKDTVPMDLGDNQRWGGGLWIFGGGLLRNPETAATTPKTTEAAYIVAGKVTFAMTDQSFMQPWEVKLGTRGDTVAEYDDIYAFRKIEVTGGKGVGQVRQIYSHDWSASPVKHYNNMSRVCQLRTRWRVQPDETSTFTIYGGPIFIISTLQGLFLQGINFFGVAPGSSNVLGSRRGMVAIAHKNVDNIASHSHLIKRSTFTNFDIGWDNNNPFYNRGDGSNCSEIMFEDSMFQSCGIGYRNKGTGAVANVFHNMHWIGCTECVRIDGGGQFSFTGMIQLVTCNHFVRRTDSGTNTRGTSIKGMLKTDSALPRTTLYEETVLHRHGIVGFEGIVIGSGQDNSESSNLQTGSTSGTLLAIQESPDYPGKCRLTFSKIRREMRRGRKITLANTVSLLYNGVHTVEYLAGQSLIRSGTARAGSNNDITLDAGASTTPDAYKGYIIRLTGGPGTGHERVIKSYDGMTQKATPEFVQSGFGWSQSTGITEPDMNTTFEILSEPEDVIHAGTCPSNGTSNMIVFDSAASGATNAYKGWLIRLVRGDGTIDDEVCTSYNGGTKTATVSGTYSPSPVAGDKFEIIGAFVDTDKAYQMGNDDLTGNVTWQDETELFQVGGGHVIVDQAHFSAIATIMGGVSGGRLARLESNTLPLKWPIYSRFDVNNSHGLQGPLDGVTPEAEYLRLAPGTRPVFYRFRDCQKGTHSVDETVHPPWTVGNF
jgi:hypothetical protein